MVLLTVSMSVDSSAIFAGVEQRGLSVWDRWKRWDHKAAAVVSRFVGVVMIPLVAAAFLGFGSVDLGPAMRAARGDGTLGTFHVRSRECDRTCTLYGDFRGDDGSIRYNVMYLDRAPRVRAGDSLRALDAGDRAGVFKPTGSREWVWIVVGLVMGGIGALWWLFRYPVRALRRLRFAQLSSSATDPTELPPIRPDTRL